MTVEKTEAISAVDVTERIKHMLNDLPEQATMFQMSHFTAQVIDLMRAYDEYQADYINAIDLKPLTAEIAKDPTTNQIASEYGLTLNQVAGFEELCTTLNRQFEGSGVTVVPFYFLVLLEKLKAQNQQLQIEAKALQDIVDRVRIKHPETSDFIKERSSIITGNRTPYIPGVNGPRMGDEHLDEDNIYL